MLRSCARAVAPVVALGGLSVGAVPGCLCVAGMEDEYLLAGESTGGDTGSGGTGGTSGAAGHLPAGGGGMGTAGGGGGTAGAGGSEPCVGDELQCLADGTAQQCVEGEWVSLGPCPLGCDVEAKACYVPSNVEPGLVDDGTAELVVQAAPAPLVFDTDTGQITSGVDIIRPEGEGLDSGSGIAFHTAAQGDGAPGLGVFSLGTLQVQQDAVLRGVGVNALVLLVDGDVKVDGTVTVAAEGAAPGPGGFAGGGAGAPGGGPCAGQPGSGAAIGHYCTSGSGGAGYGATGGPGGVCTCSAPYDFAPGLGGGVCGSAELVPLVGGSGGAGGSLALGGASLPGEGGSGGGAVQITAVGAIAIGATGRVHAGAGGGGGSEAAGGAGGGAGGAILLEAPQVTVAVGSILAANGGGGGGGDCT